MNLNSVYIKTISYGSLEHGKMLDLRQRVLRAPLGLTFTKEDIEKEKNDYLICAFIKGNDKLSGCCILTVVDKTVRLRQMAVDIIFQKKGIGSMLLSFAEEIAINDGFSAIHLHARSVSVDFYKKNGYTKTSERFIEVGIPHFAMEKKFY